MRILDADGRVREDIVDDEYHKGTGVWGREINNGMIMVVFEIQVLDRVRRILLESCLRWSDIDCAQYRRRGLASIALKKLLEKYGKGCSLVAIVPDPKAEVELTAFLHKVRVPHFGFLRTVQRC